MNVSRRTFIGGTAVVGTAWMAGCGYTLLGAAPSRTAEENRKSGDARLNARRLRPSQDGLGNIQGYASATSVVGGERLTFHVSVGREPSDFTITIHRLGHYGGAGGRLMTTSSGLQGTRQPAPSVHGDEGTVRCSWRPSWSVEIPASWPSGLYLASFISTDGHRAGAPFVVRDDVRDSEFLIVLPFTTYQAYNQFPMDGRLGKSLYYGYVPSAQDPAVRSISPDGKAYPATPVPGHSYFLHYPARARTVSFDRPYAGDGIPKSFQLDQAFIGWFEEKGFDVTYATSIDLHEGRVNPARYKAVLFGGHDEYWSAPMRSAAEKVVHHGTHLAFFTANNAYWKVRVGSARHGFPTVTCYKDDPDPAAGPTGATTRWRDVHPGGVSAEQRLLGTQFTGIVPRPLPLIASNARHWFWDGTHLANGDQLHGLLIGEADGLMADMPQAQATERASLSMSPFVDKLRGQVTQNIGLYRAPSGAWVFNAGTFGWTQALCGPPKGRDPRIQRATANLFEKLCA